MKSALILVDIQNDFLPGGALAVPDGDQVIPVCNRVMPLFELIVATQDWHPENHGSFASQHPGTSVGEMIDLNGLPQVLWPAHCVQGTEGAKLSEQLELPISINVFPKGTDVNIDSYSGFFDNGQRKQTGMGMFLKDSKIDHVYLLGLATDYCVKATALDAIQLGFETSLIEDGCRGVNLLYDDCDNAIKEMKAAGVKIIKSNQIEKRLKILPKYE